MSQPFLGEIMFFCADYAPNGWHVCDGSLLSIAEYTALYDVIGTTYGGNGQTDFAIPDLRGRVAVGQGMGPNLTERVIGAPFGSEKVSLDLTTMPNHSHAMSVYMTTSASGRTSAPNSGVALSSPTATRAFRPAGSSSMNSQLHVSALGLVGGGAAHENRQPFLTLTACIALNGVYPAQS